MKKGILIVLLTIGALAAVWWLTEPRSDAVKDAASASTAGTQAPSDSASPKTADASVGASGAALLWRARTSGENQVWRFGDKGAVTTAGLWPVGADWAALAYVPGGWAGNDLAVWRNPADGETRLWKVASGANEPKAEVLPQAGAGWRIASFVDADGDGYADVIWVNDAGSVAVWLLRDGKVGEQVVIGDTGGAWSLAQVGDFDGDGRGDLFWRKNDHGSANIWSLDGAKIKSSRGLADPGSAWTLLAAGKFDGEAGDDLLWKDATGVLSGWSGGDPNKAIAFARQAVAGWDLVAALDVDGNGRTDLLWRNPETTQTGAWLLGVSGEISDLSLTPVGLDWSPVPALPAAPTGA